MVLKAAFVNALDVVESRVIYGSSKWISKIQPPYSDPIGVIAAWLRVLRPGGIAFAAVPDKRFTFDYARPATTWQHILRDWSEGSLWSRKEHYREWAELVESTSPREVNSRVQELMNTSYSIHFHVWTSQTLREFVHRCETELSLPFTICEFVRNGLETIVVFKKI